MLVGHNQRRRRLVPGARVAVDRRRVKVDRVTRLQAVQHIAVQQVQRPFHYI